VVLDTTVTEDLEAEGWAKDRVRELQEARRSAGLDVSDRIRVVLAVPDNHLEWAQRHRDLIAGEVLAVELDLVAGHDGNATGEWIALGDGVQATVTKAG
jgi:isoleucyl-tRNA synthetase